jgi:hypothetical protein
MTKFVGSRYYLMAVLALFSFGSVSQVFANEEPDDAFEWDLVDQMRSGRVFHDRSYPPSPSEEGGYYYCPECNGWHKKSTYGSNPWDPER